MLKALAILGVIAIAAKMKHPAAAAPIKEIVLIPTEDPNIVGISQGELTSLIPELEENVGSGKETPDLIRHICTTTEEGTAIA